jgi:hypothetical protein
VKRRRPTIRLSEEQQLILALLLVLLVAISMLYCLGFASLAVRETWESAPLPWNDSGPSEEGTGAAPDLLPAEPTLPATVLP